MALGKKGNKSIINETISNVSTNMIEITEDKLINIINRHFNCIKKSKDWIGALALIITLISIHCTSTFHDVFGLSAESIRAIFIILTVLSIIYLIYTFVNCFKNRTKVEDIIKDIKGER